MWIDTHCHLDAAEFGPAHAAGLAAREVARALGVGRCVFPAVERANWTAVRDLAAQTGDAYALGIHPLFVPQADLSDLAALEDALEQHLADPRLVAVGEIGLDFFVPALCEPAMRERQLHFYRAQLALARRFGLPVLLHVRKSADLVLQGLRAMAAGGCPVAGGIAHAFNGSAVQARVFESLGFALGFGGAVTHEGAHRLRPLVQTVSETALVLETDAPDIPPQWLYVTAAQRAQGRPQGINSPAELPRIAEVLAGLRGVSLQALAHSTSANAHRVLPRLRALDALPMGVA